MAQIGTIGKQSKVTIPSKIRKKYALRRGAKVEFVEINEGVLLVPLISLRELRVAAKENYDAIIKGIEKLERGSRGKKRRDLFKKSKLPALAHPLVSG